MIALSIKKNSLNYFSVYKKSNQLNSEAYGTIKFNKNEFDNLSIEKVKKIKGIRKSKFPSKKCMIFLESSEVVLNKFRCPTEMSSEEYIGWSNQLIFEEDDLKGYSDYHYELSEKSFLSVYIEKQKQSKYYISCSDADLKLKSLSLGILSADYLARENFEAKSQKSYMVWGIGNNQDEILISQNGEIQCILNIARTSNDISLLNFIGSRELAEDTVSLLKEKIDKDLKDFNVVDKIYMYQKSSGLDMKKICNKNNKSSIVILNPLLKMGNIKQSKINLIESSYLSEMGYIFKTLESDGS